MKRTPRKRSAPRAVEPTQDRILQYIEKMAEQHQGDWSEELMDPAPHWIYLLALHLRLVELEHLESAVQELL